MNRQLLLQLCYRLDHILPSLVCHMDEPSYRFSHLSSVRNPVHIDKRNLPVASYTCEHSHLDLPRHTDALVIEIEMECIQVIHNTVEDTMNIAVCVLY